jgi:hypothetical protein
MDLTRGWSMVGIAAMGWSVLALFLVADRPLVGRRGAPIDLDQGDIPRQRPSYDTYTVVSSSRGRSLNRR